MAIEVSLSQITSGYNLAKINSNFTAIQTALADGVSRTGQVPNTMGTDLDLNGHDLLNVNSITIGGQIITFGTVLAKGAKGDKGDTGATGATGASGSGSGDMVSTQNLNDVSNKPTAFSNIKQAATSVATGVVELATDAEAITGTDTVRAVTPANVAAVFVSQLAPVNTSITAAILTAQSQPVGVNLQTGTTYTLVLTDAGKIVELSNAGAVTLTIPTNASVAFPINTVIELAQYGAGQVSVALSGGVTLNSYASRRKLTGQYSGATLYKRNTDEWTLIGDIAS